METEIAYRKLLVWQKAHGLVMEIYKVTRNFPKHETFGLTSQMCRAAVSVPANIVEGYSRKTDKEKLNFYNIARGSLSELEYFIDLSYELKYFDKSVYLILISKRQEVGKLLNGFMKYFQ